MLVIGDWGLGIMDLEALPSHQSPVPSTLSRQLVFNYAKVLNGYLLFLAEEVDWIFAEIGTLSNFFCLS